MCRVVQLESQLCEELQSLPAEEPLSAELIRYVHQRLDALNAEQAAAAKQANVKRKNVPR